MFSNDFTPKNPKKTHWIFIVNVVPLIRLTKKTLHRHNLTENILSMFFNQNQSKNPKIT